MSATAFRRDSQIARKVHDVLGLDPADAGVLLNRVSGGRVEENHERGLGSDPVQRDCGDQIAFHRDLVIVRVKGGGLALLPDRNESNSQALPAAFVRASLGRPMSEPRRKAPGVPSGSASPARRRWSRSAPCRPRWQRGWLSSGRPRCSTPAPESSGPSPGPGPVGAGLHRDPLPGLAGGLGVARVHHGKLETSIRDPSLSALDRWVGP